MHARSWRDHRQTTEWTTFAREQQARVTDANLVAEILAHRGLRAREG
jgi:hypothetical protein